MLPNLDERNSHLAATLVSLSVPHQSTHFRMPACKNVNSHHCTILARRNLLELLERRVQQEIPSWKGSAQRLPGSRALTAPGAQGKDMKGARTAPEPNAPADTMQPQDATGWVIDRSRTKKQKGN